MGDPSANPPTFIGVNCLLLGRCRKDGRAPPRPETWGCDHGPGTSYTAKGVRTINTRDVRLHGTGPGPDT